MRAVYSQPDLKSAACDDAVTAALSPLLENGQAQKMDVVKRYQLLQFVFDDMLDAWVQAAQWSHHSQGRDEPLKPLCQQAPSREDARNVHAKLTNLMRGYFLAPPEADAESDPQRALADPATFLKIFDQCVYEKPSGA